jgi:hypothetical protein
MHVRTSVSAIAIGATPEALFDRVADPAAAADFFRGFGPIPAIAQVRLLTEGPLSVGSRREVLLADGSTLPEEVIELDRPNVHRYRIVNFPPALARLMREGVGTWTFAAEPQGSRITWSYVYRLKSFWRWPTAVLFAKLLMRGAMRRAVDRLATQAMCDAITERHRQQST